MIPFVLKKSYVGEVLGLQWIIKVVHTQKYGNVHEKFHVLKKYKNFPKKCPHHLSPFRSFRNFKTNGIMIPFVLKKVMLERF